MSILKKVSAIIPNKGGDKDYFLALLITYQGVETAIWYLDGNRLKSQTFGNASFVGAGNILETAAEAIDQACEPLDVEVKDVILGLPDSWISNNQILPQYFDKLKELAKNLDIVPFAFVSQNHSIVNRLKIKYGTTICGFLLNVDQENLTLSSIKSGHLVQTRFIRADNNDIVQGLQKLFAHFTLSPQDCEYVYIAGHPIPPGVEDAIGNLPLFANGKPKVSRLDPEFAVRAIALAGAVDRGNLAGLHVEDEEVDETTIAQLGVTEDPIAPKQSDASLTAAAAIPPAASADHANAPMPGVPATPPLPPTGQAPMASAAAVPTQLPEGFVMNQDISTAKAEEPPSKPNEEVPVEKKVEPPVYAVPNAMAPKHMTVEPIGAPHDVPSVAEPPPMPAAIPVINSAAVHDGAPVVNGPEPTSTPTNEFAVAPKKGGLLAGLKFLPHALPKLLLTFLSLPTKLLGSFSFLSGNLVRLLFLFVTPVIVLLLAAGAFVTLTKANVEVIFLPRTLESTLPVTVNPKLTTADISTRQIPGTTLSTDVAGELRGQATGKKKVGEKAKGSVTLFNKTATAKSFQKNTVITTNDLAYVLEESVTVPARTATESADREIVIKPGKITATVAAEDIGEQYNIPSGTDFLIKGSAKDSFDGQASAAFAGGSARDVTVLSEDDIKRTETQLTANLKDQAKSALLGKVDQNQQIIDDSIVVTIGKRTTSKKAGDETADFTLEANATAKATVYAKDALQALVDQAVKDQIPDEYNLGDNGVTGNAIVKRSEQSGEVIVDWHYQAQLVPKLDEEELKKALAGKSFDYATNRVQGIPNVSQVVIMVNPQPFQVVKRMPLQASKITVTTKTAQ